MSNIDISKYTKVIVEALILSRKTTSDDEFEASVKKIFAPFSKKERKSKKNNTNGASTAADIKRPKSPYMFFMQENRSDVPAGTKFGDVAKQIAAKWAALTESEKEKYVLLSTADKARYETDKKNAAAASSTTSVTAATN